VQLVMGLVENLPLISNLRNMSRNRAEEAVSFFRLSQIWDILTESSKKSLGHELTVSVIYLKVRLTALTSVIILSLLSFMYKPYLIQWKEKIDKKKYPILKMLQPQSRLLQIKCLLGVYQSAFGGLHLRNNISNGQPVTRVHDITYWTDKRFGKHGMPFECE